MKLKYEGNTFGCVDSLNSLKFQVNSKDCLDEIRRFRQQGNFFDSARHYLLCLPGITSPFITLIKCDKVLPHGNVQFLPRFVCPNTTEN